MQGHQLELLAPARDADIGIEAVRHGADAVYIGGPAFGARANAGNAVADIARLADYAHVYHARVYATINTILRDDELEPARRLAWQLYEAGVDALIVQDMGLLELDMPPLPLHASTQTDIRSPEKARFLQAVGFSQLVLARELTLEQIAAIRAVTTVPLEFFVHGALCVAYSGQCYISHAQAGRSANRGDCSQACRLPYRVTDQDGRVLAHDKHVLSLKDNDQSGNLEALIDAGIRSFKIEGRYKDLGYVKNVTAHYRLLLDRIMARRTDLARASSGRCTYTFTPDPEQNFNRGTTDYFLRGRQQDIGAFDSPKNPGRPIGWVVRVGPDHIDIDSEATLHNGDGLCYFDLRRNLVGLAIDRAEALGAGRWRVWPNTHGAALSRSMERSDMFVSPTSARKGERVAVVPGLPACKAEPWAPPPSRRRGASGASAQGFVGRGGKAVLHGNAALADLKDLCVGTEINRNRDMAWLRLLERQSAERRMRLDMVLSDADGVLCLRLCDEDGITAEARAELDWQAPHDAEAAASVLRDSLSKLGETPFFAGRIELALSRPWFAPGGAINRLRRDGVAALLHARRCGWQRDVRAPARAATYPEDSLSYLGNVFNSRARDFYARHGVRLIAAAYESHEQTGDVPLMITRHCVRYSLSLCPRQTRGVVGVHGTIKAEPLRLINGDEELTLRFDCKACEMHVVGRIKRGVLKQRAREMKVSPLRFYRTRP